MSVTFQNKNIVFLLKSPQLGGAERQALSLAGYLQNNKECKVYIYTYLNEKPSRQFLDFCKEHKLKHVYTVKNPLIAGSRFKYYKIRLKLFLFGMKLRKHKPDIIIPYLNGPSLIAAFCKKISGAKITFWNCRGQEVYRNDLLEKKAVSLSNIFVVNSPDSEADIIKNFKVHKQNIHFLPNFSTTRPIKIVESSKANHELVIGMLAHFRSEKLQILLLESFLELSKKYPYVRLHLVGDVIDLNKKNEAQNFVKKHKLENKVSFMHGKLAKEVLPFFDIAVLMSVKEGMSNSIMEYMSYQLPVICTNHQGSQCLLGQENPFLIDNNVEELTDKLTQMIESEHLRVSEGKKNQTRIENGFTIENYILGLEKILNGENRLFC